jgi:hypothetical protein
MTEMRIEVSYAVRRSTQLNESLFQNITAAVRTLCWLFENVIPSPCCRNE